jgi:hypothetical protein
MGRTPTSARVVEGNSILASRPARIRIVKITGHVLRWEIMVSPPFLG